MAPGRGKEKAAELLNKYEVVFKTFRTALGKIRIFLTAGKGRFMLFGFAGVIVLVLILIITATAAHSGKPEKSAPVSITAGPAIPTEDLFVPGEPDFLPRFIPEREPRSSWSVEDISPYWRNPEKSDIWREEIKTAVDKLMEAVP